MRVTLTAITICWIVIFTSMCVAQNCPDRERGETQEFNWIRQEESSDVLLVFVHGIDGCSQETWGTDDSNWPDKVRDDPLFMSVDILTTDYFSTKWAESDSIDKLTTAFYQDVVLVSEILGRTENGSDRYEEIIFVAHSMGGLIVRNLLLNYEDVRFKTPAIFTFATPTGGSGLANWLAPFTSSDSVDDLRELFGITYETNTNGEIIKIYSGFLSNLRMEWRNKGFLDGEHKVMSYCGYETLRTNGALVVREQNAEYICNRTMPLNERHNETVRPHENWQGHKLLQAWFSDEFPNRGNVGANETAGDVVIARCSSDFYPDDYYGLLGEWLDDIGNQQNISWRFSSELPRDWRSEYRNKLWHDNNVPAAIVMHYSCFKEERRDVLQLNFRQKYDEKNPRMPYIWYERKIDNVNFLNDLADTKVRIVYFSRAFVKNSTEVVGPNGTPGLRWGDDVNDYTQSALELDRIPEENLNTIKQSFFKKNCTRIRSVATTADPLSDPISAEKLERNFKKQLTLALTATCN